jgi:hypothetical protein
VPAGDNPGLGDGVLFSPSSFANTPIGSTPVDPGSDAVMTDFRARVQGNGQVTCARYGQPLYMLADAERRGATVNRYSVDQTRYPSPKRYLRNVPIPVGARADSGDDGYLNDHRRSAVRPGTRLQLRHLRGGADGAGRVVWAASSANRKRATNDDGNYKPGEGSGPRGSSFAAALGVLRPEEIWVGINHALFGDVVGRRRARYKIALLKTLQADPAGRWKIRRLQEVGRAARCRGALLALRGRRRRLEPAIPGASRALARQRGHVDRGRAWDV